MQLLRLTPSLLGNLENLRCRALINTVHKIKVPTLAVSLSLGRNALFACFVVIHVLGTALVALFADLRKLINWIFLL